MRDPDDLRAFARRDWPSIVHLKEDTWRDAKRIGGPAEGIRVASALWEHARALRPAWPSGAEREADHAVHLRVLDALRRVPPRRR